MSDTEVSEEESRRIREIVGRVFAPVDSDEVAKALGAQRIGEGTTTLDMLYANYPWLKTLIENKDKEIATLKRAVRNLGGRCEAD